MRRRPGDRNSNKRRRKKKIRADVSNTNRQGVWAKKKILLRFSEHTAHSPHNSPAQNLFRILTCVNQPANGTHTKYLEWIVVGVVYLSPTTTLSSFMCEHSWACVCFFFWIITILTCMRTVWNFIEKQPSHTRTNRIDTKRYAHNASNRSAHTFSMPKEWRRWRWQCRALPMHLTF